MRQPQQAKTDLQSATLPERPKNPQQEKFCELILALGWKPSEVADFLQVSEGFVSQVRSGKRTPSETLLKFLSYEVNRRAGTEGNMIEFELFLKALPAERRQFIASMMLTVGKALANEPLS